MKTFFTRKLSLFLTTLVGVSLAAFFLIRLAPGDPVLLMLGERGGSEEQYRAMEQKLGLHHPLYKQYLIFVGNAMKGDLGTSIVTLKPVTTEFLSRFPATLELGFCAILFAILLGVPAGIIAALKHNSLYDYGLMGLSLIGHSMPIFWWALILIIIFSVKLGITPVSGRLSALHDLDHATGFMLIDTLWQGKSVAFVSALKHLILPTIVIGTIPLAIIARMTRSGMLEVMNQDYIRTARAKGLREQRIVIFHGLRNALVPVVTIIGLQCSSILTGAILTETLFSWPGIGKWIVLSVTQRDYPVIQGSVIIIASMVMGINMLVDFLYTLLNPKLREKSSQ